MKRSIGNRRYLQLKVSMISYLNSYNRQLNMADNCSIMKGKEQVVAVEKDDSEGVSPAVGILFSFSPPENMAATLRRLCPAMRIVFVSDGNWTRYING